MFGEFANAVKSRVSAAIHFSIWGMVAGVLALVAAGFFVAALYSWLADYYGEIQASLAIGGGFLVIALVILLIAAIQRRRAKMRLRQQQQRVAERLSATPVSLTTTLMTQLIGPKQTTALMLVAIVVGYLVGRPRSSHRD